ncbi:unnamed protein product [Ixodes hexagonus]
MKSRLLAGTVFLLMEMFSAKARKRSFVVDYENSCFLKDGQPFRFVAGSIHYFRVPRAYWRDRLYKMKMAGLNVIDTYIEWSGHQPERNVFNFEDEYDLEAFLEIAQDIGLLVIVRPGPYICGERDNGGFPYWLLRYYPDMKYRSMDRNYVKEVERWFHHILRKLKGYLYNKGGPIIMVQVENEYGHYPDCNKNYMEFMLSLLESHLGHDVVYFRSDSPSEERYACDAVRDALVAGCCDPKAQVESAFKIISDAMPIKGGPIVVSEYYTGWMDYWGFKHNPADPPRVVGTFEDMMNHNASVTFYMFHGGTSFGFGAATSSTSPLVTSYDYDAPMSESGDPRPLYYMIRNSTAKYLPLPDGDPPGSSKKMQLGEVRLRESISLTEVMDYFRERDWLRRAESELPMTFEELGQDYGFIVYSAHFEMETVTSATLEVVGLRDRAYIFLRDKTEILYVLQNETSVTANLTRGETLTILVENMGREDFGRENHDRKGLTDVMVNGTPLRGWTMEAVPVTRNKDVSNIMQLLEAEGKGEIPGFFHGTFQLPEGEPADTFLDPKGWSKGIAFVNGINLGRYWATVGPQITLYVPAPFLLPHPEENRLFLLELEKAPDDRRVHLVDTPLLDADF